MTVFVCDDIVSALSSNGDENAVVGDDVALDADEEAFAAATASDVDLHLGF